MRSGSAIHANDAAGWFIPFLQLSCALGFLCQSLTEVVFLVYSHHLRAGKDKKVGLQTRHYTNTKSGGSGNTPSAHCGRSHPSSSRGLTTVRRLSLMVRQQLQRNGRCSRVTKECFWMTWAKLHQFYGRSSRYKLCNETHAENEQKAKAELNPYRIKACKQVSRSISIKTHFHDFYGSCHPKDQ